MTSNDYIKERVDGQIIWYSEKSTSNKKLYLFFKISEIVIAASIPFLVGFLQTCPYIKYLIGLFGVLITIIAGLMLVFKFQEKWLSYRTTSESLKHEKYLFETSTGFYKSEDSFNLFVERIESLISKENSEWNNMIAKTDFKKDIK